MASDFRAGQVMRHLDVGPFSRDRQDPLGNAEGGRIGSGDMVEERSDRSEPGIAGGDRVVPLFLKLVEKGENEIPIEIIECQRRRLLAQTGRGEEDQHTQGVAIAGQGGGGGVALLGQSASEIGLQERGQKEVLTHARLRRGRRAQLRWRGDPTNR